MDYIKLGSSSLNVSKICLGCMGFGEAEKGIHSWTLPYEDSFEIIKYAVENGINFFDTALAYQEGTSELFLGKAISKLNIRDKTIIATKFMPRSDYEISQNISAKTHIETCLNMSLKNLGTDYIDLYILHKWDYHTPIEELLEALNSLVLTGKIRYLGISNCYAWQIAKANEIARANGWSQFISVQGHYNLIFREEEREMIPFCQEHNISITPYSSLASGRLSRSSNETTKRFLEDKFAISKYSKTFEEDLLIIKRVEEIATKRNISMTEVSLAWLLKNSSSPIIGATKLNHINGALNSLKVSLNYEEINYLEELYYPHPLVGIMAEKRKE